MKKVLFIVALLAVALAATPASAFTTDANALPSGPLVGKFSNFSDLYIPTGDTFVGITGGTNGTPIGFGEAGSFVNPTNGAVAPLENRAVFNTTSINLPSTTSAWLPVNEQLTGLFYNLTLIGVTSTSKGLQLDFGPSTRNPLTSGPGLASAPVGSGGVIAVYLNPASPFGTPGQAPDPNNVGALVLDGTKSPATINSTATINNGTGPWAPASWVQGTSGSPDTYVGATGGSLWLSGEFVPFSDVLSAAQASLYTPGTVFSETLNFGTGNGSATGYIHLVGGSYYTDVGEGDLGLGPYVDMVLGADEYSPSQDPITGNLDPVLNYNGAGFWPVDSDDPVNFNVVEVGVPEPATLSLLGFGLAGLLIRRRK